MSNPASSRIQHMTWVQTGVAPVSAGPPVDVYLTPDQISALRRRFEDPNHMHELDEEQDLFERALDICQIVWTVRETDQLRLCRRRRRLAASGVTDQTSFIAFVEACLVTSDFSTISCLGE